MITRIVLAVIVAVIVGFLLAIVLGPLLVMLKAPPATFIGGIFVEWGWPIGVVAGLWHFFVGGSFTFPQMGKKP